MQIPKWVVALYKKPEKNLSDNEIFNNYISILRIRSEHTIGFLKGRFQSLKRLRVLIKDAETHRFATYWVIACIVVHTYAMRCEKEERGDDNESWDPLDDPFLVQGLSVTQGHERTTGETGSESANQLRVGKEFREVLKKVLFTAKGMQLQSASV